MSEHTSCNVSSCQTCADDAVETLRAELAQSQAREAVLVEALEKISRDFREQGYIRMSRIDAFVSDISPAAKALLERAEKGDKALEALWQIRDGEWMADIAAQEHARTVLAELEEES